MMGLGKEHGQWRTERGAVTTWMLAPNILVSRAEGYVDTELAEHIVASGNDVIARHGSLVAFHDWQQISGYDSKARTRLTKWGDAIRDEVKGVHILVGSKLVKMGVTVASLVLGNMLTAYDDRARFEKAFRAAREA